LFSYILYFTTSRLNPRLIGTKFLRIFIFLHSFFKPTPTIDLRRLSDALNFSRRDRRAGSFEKSIELVFVSIKKDFPVLVESIKFAKLSISRYQYGGVRVIVPELEVSECEALFLKSGLGEISVVSENTLVSPDSVDLLRATFNGRANWVLQQILKVQAVLTSTSDASLIVDSDTLLLTRRPWFSANSSQLLTPSYEYNAPYYYFLERLSISDQNPKYTFISHHMLMQKLELAETFLALEWGDVHNMIEYICQNANAELESPVCVEYELYAQALLRRSPSKVHFGTWSNISISRVFLDRVLTLKYALWVLSICFHSVSLHSWSTNIKDS
jgi:hypothetical protein